MSLSRTALALGFLLLNACGAGAVTSSNAQSPSLPSGGLGAGPQGNTPSSGERPLAAVERASAGGPRTMHEPAARTLSFGCRSCRY